MIDLVILTRPQRPSLKELLMRRVILPYRLMKSARRTHRECWMHSSRYGYSNPAGTSASRQPDSNIHLMKNMSAWNFLIPRITGTPQANRSPSREPCLRPTGSRYLTGKSKLKSIPWNGAGGGIPKETTSDRTWTAPTVNRSSIKSWKAKMANSILTLPATSGDATTWSREINSPAIPPELPSTWVLGGTTWTSRVWPPYSP